MRDISDDERALQNCEICGWLLQFEALTRSTQCLARTCKHEKFQIVGHSKVTCMQYYAGTIIDEQCIWQKCRQAWEINQQSLLTFLLSIYLLGTYFAYIGHVISILGFIRSLYTCPWYGSMRVGPCANTTIKSTRMITKPWSYWFYWLALIDDVKPILPGEGIKSSLDTKTRLCDQLSISKFYMI